VEVKFVKPTQELIEAIAADMRQADVEEVWASNRHTPMQAMIKGAELSDYSLIVMVDDEPCVMIGLVVHDILTGTGVPWLLGTEKALKHKRNFLIQVPAIIDEMLSICPRLFNYVHVKNKVSINWLRRIGFSFDDPEPYGLDGELFQRFYLERV